MLDHQKNVVIIRSSK